MQYRERPTRANAGIASTSGDGPNTGARTGGASDGASGIEPKAPAATATSTIDKERNASVLRIAVHLKEARMLVAVASRLDTPTTAAATAAAAAATDDQSKREARAWRETSAAATACEENAAVEDGVDGLLDEEVQSPDAEVLPRDWKVANNSPVYLRNRSTLHGLGMARESSGTGGVNSPFLRRNGSSIYRDTSPRSKTGTPYRGDDSRGGSSRGGGRLSYRGDRRSWQRGGSNDGGWHDGDMDDGHHRAATNGGSSAGAGATDTAEDHSGSWLEPGQGQLRWREITQQPFDLMLLVDNGKDLECTRVLLTMPEYGIEDQEKARRKGRSPGGLYICPTMAEYCLLLSVYFGERPRKGGVRRWGESAQRLVNRFNHTHGRARTRIFSVTPIAPPFDTIDWFIDLAKRLRMQ